jgi:hypothetical protein
MTNDPNAFQRGQSAFDTNPYAPTAHVGTSLSQVSEDVDAYRREHLKHEVSVKSIGLLYLLGAVIMILAGIGMFVVPLSGGGNAGQNAPPPAFFAGFGLVYLSLGIFQFFVGRGLRRLQPWTRIATSVLSVIGLLGFPIGTLISAYILYLMLSTKGQVVFSDEYKQVMLQTPHIQYKTPLIVWILVVILALVLVVAIVGAVTVG